VHDLNWRLAHLPWRHRVLLRGHAVRGVRVLDFGCGDGVFAIALARHGGVVTGYDHSPAAIAQARRFAGDAGPSFVHEALPEGPFDRIFCTQVLEHVIDEGAVVAALAARLAPGGAMIGSVPLGRFFWDPDHRRTYDEVGLGELLRPYGLTRIRRYYRSPLRNWLPWPQSGAAVLLFELRPPVPAR
jgi:2-polyprenyl-3-methyl-5-hydroxy-6-metoxy-1,4-benzoquinol methylase